MFRLHFFSQDPQDPRVQVLRVLYKHSGSTDSLQQKLRICLVCVGSIKNDLGHFCEHFECKDFLSGEYHSGISYAFEGNIRGVLACNCF